MVMQQKECIIDSNLNLSAFRKTESKKIFIAKDLSLKMFLV